jgi:hypothetical protein
MDREQYWALIDQTRARSGGDPDAHEAALRAAVAELTPDEITDFERHTTELLDQSFRSRLWGAAYLINGGCSDDGFDYFRGWLIAQGRATYEAALANPDSLADFPGIGDHPVELEGLWYMARAAYEAKTGVAMPDDLGAKREWPNEGDVGFDFDDDDAMRDAYPRLFARCADE